MPEYNIKDLFKETGALKKGHFLLASGLHSEFYFQAQTLLQYPRKASEAGRKIAEQWDKNKVDTVVSLAVGAIVLGQEVARHMNCRHIFVERQNKNFLFKRNFSLKKNEKVLLVEDVITTGGSVMEAREVIKKTGASIEGIACMLLRGDVNLGYTVRPLLKTSWKTYTPAKCLQCKKGIKLYTPGTKQSL